MVSIRALENKLFKSQVMTNKENGWNFLNYFSYHGDGGQGTNGRKVISEVYAFFVLQCTVFGRKSKHKTDVTA